ncbi:MAG: hypothetical protein V8T31_05005 [Lachnospiraceae bacterium]
MFYFKDHFFLHTMINGFDASRLTVEEVEEKVADRIADYRLRRLVNVEATQRRLPQNRLIIIMCLKEKCRRS